MIFGLLLQLLVLGGLVALAVVVTRRMRGHAGAAGTVAADGHAVRRFFQYALLLGSMVIAAIGVAGLLGQLVERSAAVTADPVEIARNLTFTLVGLPVGVLVALVCRRTLAHPQERGSWAWSGYLTVAGLLALVMTMVAGHDTATWLIGGGPRAGHALGRLVVWGGVWAVHWWVARRVPAPQPLRVHLLLGSLAGLVASVLGAVSVLAGAAQLALGWGSDRLVGGSPLQAGTASLLVGVPVWLWYWVGSARRLDPEPLWVGFVLLAGAGGGLATAVVGAARTGYDLLVWWVGRPELPLASGHFHNTPQWAATALLGLLVRWYHHRVLVTRTPPDRTEVHRIHDYLMAGIGLVTSVVGVTVLVVALVEAGTRGALLVGGSTVNLVLAAVTVLAAGLPVWAGFWYRIRRAVRLAPEQERTAASRRVYLTVVTGLAALVALVALLVAVFLLLEDVFRTGAGSATLHRMRVPLGLLVGTLATAGYHGTIWWRERTATGRHPVVPAPGEEGRHHPRYVLLLGPGDDVADAVARRLGVPVQCWPRTDLVEQQPWSADDVVALLDRTDGEELVVLREVDGLHAIPVRRREGSTVG